MQKDDLVETIARALFGENVKDGMGNLVTFDTCHQVHRDSAISKAKDAIHALKMARPDVAAVLDEDGAT